MDNNCPISPSPNGSDLDQNYGCWDVFAGTRRPEGLPYLGDDVLLATGRCADCGKRRRPCYPRQSLSPYQYNSQQGHGDQQPGSGYLPYSQDPLFPPQQPIFEMPNYNDYNVQPPYPHDTRLPIYAPSTSSATSYPVPEIHRPTQGDVLDSIWYNAEDESLLILRDDLLPQRESIMATRIVNNHYHFDGNAPVTIKAAPDYSQIDNSKDCMNLAWGDARMNISHGYSAM